MSAPAVAAVRPSRLLRSASTLAALGLCYVLTWLWQGGHFLLCLPVALAAASCAAPRRAEISRLAIGVDGAISVVRRQARVPKKIKQHLHAKAWLPTVPYAIVTQNYTAGISEGGVLHPWLLLLRLRGADGRRSSILILPDSVGRATLRDLIVALNAIERAKMRAARPDSFDFYQKFEARMNLLQSANSIGGLARVARQGMAPSGN